MNACPYCGNTHKGMCARVKAVEYRPDGTIDRVEFHPPEQEIAAAMGFVAPAPQEDEDE